MERKLKTKKKKKKEEQRRGVLGLGSSVQVENRESNKRIHVTTELS